MNSNKNNILKKIENLKEESEKNKNDIIFIHKTNYKNNIKCWWCKHLFNGRPVNMPISYINNKFTVQGVYCSFNCCLSDSLEIGGDRHWYRKSLINYYYYKTYGKYKNITPAPNWRCLKDFGGFLSIEEFRNNFLTKDYIFFEPPIISRSPHILELKKTNDYVLKRTKPIKRTIKDINNFLS